MPYGGDRVKGGKSVGGEKWSCQVTCPQVGREMKKQWGRECACARTRSKKLLQEGFLMPESRGCCWHCVLEGRVVMPPPWHSGTARAGWPQCFLGEEE